MTPSMHYLSAQDNDLYFYHDRTDVARCEACQLLLRKWDEDLTSVALKKNLKRDASYSYDGVLVVSAGFKFAVENAQIPGMDFRQLQEQYFAARPTRTVPFDVGRRATKFGKRCDFCGQHAFVIGATPVFLMPGAGVGPKECVRTDLEFGTGDNKAPVVLFGDDAVQKLKKTKLRGLCFLPVK